MRCLPGFWSDSAAGRTGPVAPRWTKGGSFLRKAQRRLNLTRLPNGSSLNPYVESSPIHSIAQLSATTFRAGAAEPGYPRGGGARARGWVSDAPGGSCQCGGGDPGLRLLRVVSNRHCTIESVAHHGTVPAIALKTWGMCRLRANSSAGSERLPYTQDVGGSNPSSPTHARANSGAVAGPRGPSCWGD